MNQEALNEMVNGTKDDRIYLAEQEFGLFAIFYFTDYFKYSLAPYHYDMLEDVKKLLSGDLREVVWVMFRESAKTTFAKLLIIWLIIFKKRKYINVDSFDKENAERILFDVAYELSNNKLIHADFGVFFSKKRSIEDIKQNKINNFVTENGVRVEAHSTQESIRGRVHLDQRPDCLVLDDFETNKTKDSQAYTKQVRDHITEALAGMAPNAFILYLCNYITEYGNVQMLMDRAKNDPRLHIRNVPVMVNGKPSWEAKYVLTDAEAKQTGKVSIEDKERQLGSQVFSYEMMNTPIDESTAEFKREWIMRATEEEVSHLNTLCFVTIDGAVSEKESADFTGVTINRVSTENKWYVINYRMKINTKELIDHLFYIQKTYTPDVIGIEKTTFTMAIQPFLEEEMRKRNVFMYIVELEHKQQKKETRIRGLIPRMQNKGIFFIGDTSAIEDETRTFPRGQHDDALDSLAYQEQIAYPPKDIRQMASVLSSLPKWEKPGIE